MKHVIDLVGEAQATLIQNKIVKQAQKNPNKVIEVELGHSKGLSSKLEEVTSALKKVNSVKLD